MQMTSPALLSLAIAAIVLLAIACAQLWLERAELPAQVDTQAQQLPYRAREDASRMETPRKHWWQHSSHDTAQLEAASPAMAPAAALPPPLPLTLPPSPTTSPPPPAPSPPPPRPSSDVRAEVKSEKRKAKAFISCASREGANASYAEAVFIGAHIPVPPTDLVLWRRLAGEMRGRRTASLWLLLLKETHQQQHDASSDATVDHDSSRWFADGVVASDDEAVGESAEAALRYSEQLDIGVCVWQREAVMLRLPRLALALDDPTGPHAHEEDPHLRRYYWMHTCLALWYEATGAWRNRALSCQKTRPSWRPGQSLSKPDWPRVADARSCSVLPLRGRTASAHRRQIWPKRASPCLQHAGALTHLWRIEPDVIFSGKLPALLDLAAASFAALELDPSDDPSYDRQIISALHCAAMCLSPNRLYSDVLAPDTHTHRRADVLLPSFKTQESDEKLAKVYRLEDWARFPHWRTNENMSFLRGVPAKNRRHSLVSVGRYSLPFLKHLLAAYWEQGSTGYEELLLPVACQTAYDRHVQGKPGGFKCVLGAFGPGGGVASLFNASANHIRYRPEVECAEVAAAVAQRTNELWHPVKNRACLV